MHYRKGPAISILIATLLSIPSSAPAQVSINIGPEPACPYGYYDYAPYNCAPYGYYRPECVEPVLSAVWMTSVPR